MSDLSPELARVIKERDEARLWEKDALFDLGRLSEQLRLLARGVIRDDPEVKEVASDLLTGGRPKVLVEAQEGGRIRGWGAEFLARMFVEELERHGAENFVEWTMESVGLKVQVTIQRLDGRRPTEIIAELTAECERLRRARDAATEKVREAADRAAARWSAAVRRVGECIVCLDPTTGNSMMCCACGRSYDRWNATADRTNIALIEWAAGRARRTAAAKARSRRTAAAKARSRR